MLFFADSPSQSRLLAKRTERGALTRLARGIYSDDFQRSPEEQIADGILAIVGHYYPSAYVSHSSAATRTTVDGLFFLSTASQSRRPVVLPGVKIVRLPALPYPEIQRIDAPSMAVTTRDREPRTIAVAVSTPLQTVFECLMPSRRYPEKQLPEGALLELVERLSSHDHRRIRAFVERNRLEHEYERFLKLLSGAATRAAVKTIGSREFQLYFYNWHVGNLTAMENGEFRFVYQPGWQIELSRELPLRSDGASYEGPRMPAYFENFLPEGWTENRILKTYGLDPSDTVGLLASTRKYLSNLTLRPLGIPDDQFRLDTHDVRLAELAPDSADIIRAHEHIEQDPETSQFWKDRRDQGVVGLSGIQPKLPVALTLEEGAPLINIGDLRHSCTHILKLPSVQYKFLVENEWVTMELGQRCGLPVASVRLIDFDLDSSFGRSLLVERYDIPTAVALREGLADLELMLQEDACSLLILPRAEKYRSSVERVVDVFRDLGVSPDVNENGLWSLLRHVAFSWMVANGDLHTKNFSAIRVIRAGQLGAPPALTRVEYSPLYDLVNTDLVFPRDRFAIPINGKQNQIRVRDFGQVVERWHGDKRLAEKLVLELAGAVRRHLDGVLGAPHLPAEMSERYHASVNARLTALGA